MRPSPRSAKALGMRSSLICCTLMMLLQTSPTSAQAVAEETPAATTTKPRFTEAQTKLQNLEKHLETLTKKIIPATVALRIGGSGGSGVIISKDGYVLTAAHVFDKPGQRVRIILHDGSTVRGKTLGRMMSADFGMVQITSEGEWPFVEMGTSSQLRKGDLCIATGHPGGFQKGRTPPLRFGRIRSTRGKFMRSSCAVDRGDSGGPLFDLEGKVIGIHSRIGAQVTANYHIPIDLYRKSWDELVAKKSWTDLSEVRFPRGPIIGINGVGPHGVRIRTVYPGLPADKAGLRTDDVIIEIDNTPVKDMDELKAFVAKKKAGDSVKLKYQREGYSRTAKVTLVERK